MNALAITPTCAETASLDYPIFKKAMLNACRVVEKRNTIAVLDTVLITARSGGVDVIGTDLDIYTTTFVPGSVSADFVALIDAHKLKGLMDKVKDAARINFTLEQGALTAAIGKLRLSLKQDVPEDDFPLEMAFRSSLQRSNVAFTIRASALLTALSKVEFAISTEETRYYLNGVFMHFHEGRGQLTFVATDGHRLGRYEILPPPGCEAMDDAGAIIPRKTVGELLRLLKRKDCPADVAVRVTPTAISFGFNGEEMLESKLVDGTFPDYQRVMPASNSNQVTARTAEFITALKQASSISSDRGKSVKLGIAPEALTLSCSDPDFGSVSTEIYIDTNAEPFEIGFNAQYLLEILGQLDGGAMMHLGDAGSPGIIKDGADNAVTYVLMPLRV
ncbi:DNA polymerase III subunit beta [Rhizobium sp. SSA_523]|uniref:DNA polymerase III subunit beta n=1 Tax=Rhizobium sp. SSA_523 TaxID=2952477 RepID=UPI0020900BED|nr:DNA polymerase III subunit beta [Rhizobium sp. SSA_523]MCO5730119.1 DNA polymerase III subunit beta [Rhizobium sp. SSA_523]WKC25184.1 DNA polymerase III subunit beta [Rhizobium sp. SSA_523]